MGGHCNPIGGRNRSTAGCRCSGIRLGPDGERTGEKLHLLPIDLAGFTIPAASWASNSTCPGATAPGKTDVISYSGTFFAEEGIIAFFDALATR